MKADEGQAQSLMVRCDETPVEVTSPYVIV
jgi:hypothetical protein